MKILIDLQSCQSPSRLRGIGRYSIDLVSEMISICPNDIEIHLLLNIAHENTIIDLRSIFENKIDMNNIHVWDGGFQTSALEGKESLIKPAELVREFFIKSINPDFFLITSLFEGIGDPSLTSVPNISGSVGVILYDLIPFLNKESYLENPLINAWYLDKIESLKNDVDYIFSISESAKVEAIQYLGISESKIINISSAVSSQFYLDDSCVFKKPDFINGKEKFLLYTANLDPRKNLDGLFKAYSLLKSDVKKCLKLVIVSFVDSTSKAEMISLAKKMGVSEKSLIITGFISDQDLIYLYKTCYLFVFPSLHEGFGLPCLEAMACNAAVIGSNTTSIPEVIGMKEALFSPTDPEEIANLIVKAFEDVGYYKRLKENAKKQKNKFSWERSANILFNTLSNLESEVNLDQTLFEADKVFFEKMKGLLFDLKDSDLKKISQSVESIYGNKMPSLYIDITAIAEFDAKTGIQRVVYSIINNIPEKFYNYNIKFVVLTGIGWYEYADLFQEKIFGKSSCHGVIYPLKGDIFIGLDLIADKSETAKKMYIEWRSRGVKIAIVVYDLLPILHPEFFHDGIRKVFPNWFEMVVECSDLILCISKSVADDVNNLKINVAKRKLLQSVGFFHLGADFDNNMSGVSSAFEDVDLSKTFLMVGTIEPRKGYLQALRAFELLLEEKNDYNLIIVGKAGWNSDELIKRLEEFNLSSNNIRWLNSVSDDELSYLYNNSCVLIASSYGEGFGLPLIEAAHHALPIIARDLPVFREVASNAVFYFDKDSSDMELMKKYLEWICLYEGKMEPCSSNIKFLTWKKSSETFLFSISEYLM
tara:strand:+ start:8828 stop:11287 length:2460 start_codon:yes stop_codon:yes gene_type:complete